MEAGILLRTKKMKMETHRLNINLHSLKEGKNNYHLMIEPDEMGINKSLLSESVECNFELTRNNTKVHLKGSLTFVLHLECARCYENFTLKKTELVEAYFIKRDKTLYSENEELSPEDILTELYDDDMINLVPVFYDTIILSIPMKPLCKEDCKGLCPICGANLNYEQCNCKKEITDPRWEPLKRLNKK